MGLFDWIKKDNKAESDIEKEEPDTKDTDEISGTDEQEKASDTKDTDEASDTNEPYEVSGTDEQTEDEASIAETEISGEEETAPPEDSAEPEDKKGGIFKRLVGGLAKTRNSISESLSSVFAANHIDDDFYDELEETLIMADMGVSTTMNILDELRESVKKKHIKVGLN